MKQQSIHRQGPLDEGAHSPAPTSALAGPTAATTRPFALPADPATIGSGLDRKTGPALPTKSPVVPTVRSESPLHPDVLSHAVKRTRQSLGRFDVILAISLMLRGTAGGPFACWVHVDFIAGPSVVVGHSGGEMLSAIDTALDTTAHIVASRTWSPT